MAGSRIIVALPVVVAEIVSLRDVDGCRTRTHWEIELVTVDFSCVKKMDYFTIDHLCSEGSMVAKRVTLETLVQTDGVALREVLSWDS